jgi:hypothetical protein
MSKVWSKEEIKDLLDSNDMAVKKGLINLYSLQTEDERDSENTKYQNGVGFSGKDADFMTSLAKQLLERGTLSPRQLACARKNMKGYAGQLAKIANGEIKVKPVESDKFPMTAKKADPVADVVADGKKNFTVKTIEGKKFRVKGINMDDVLAKYKKAFPDDWYGINIFEDGTDNFMCIAVREYYEAEAKMNDEEREAQRVAESMETQMEMEALLEMEAKAGAKIDEGDEWVRSLEKSLNDRHIELPAEAEKEDDFIF